MMAAQLKLRTKKLGLTVIKLLDELPTNTSAVVIARQITRSSTSIGANYRATCRAKSGPDFINKLGLLRRRLMKHYIGSRCWRRQI
jgi:four helix bundle protein